MDDLPPAELAKRAAAARALEFIEDGMLVGLGTGSTAKWFVDLLAKSRRKVVCVPTSSRTREQAQGLGIELTTLEDAGQLDVTVDGADEFDDALNLIKGGGGALLQEKIVASSSAKMVVISDPSKEVLTLGAYPLPVEIVKFGWGSTAAQVGGVLSKMGLAGKPMEWRGGDNPYITDEGHYILDLHLGSIPDPERLNLELNIVPGVVETGLFCNIASSIVVGETDGSARLIEPA